MDAESVVAASYCRNGFAPFEGWRGSPFNIFNRQDLIVCPSNMIVLLISCEDAKDCNGDSS